MSRQTLATVARDLLESAAHIAANIDTALRSLDDALAGYPATEAGSGGSTECPHPDCTLDRPCPIHDNDLGHDTAAATIASLAKLRHVLTEARRLEVSVTRWAYTRTDATTVARSLAAIDHDQWCENCIRYGERNARTHGRYCEFCTQVKGSKLSHGQYPNAQLLGIKATRRVYEADIVRCLPKPGKKAKAVAPIAITKRADVQANAAERRAKRILAQDPTSAA